MVINLEVVAQSRFQLSCRGETGLVDDLADAAVEALHHAVSLPITRRNKSMLNLELCTQAVKYMLAAGYFLTVVIFLFAGKAVGKLAAIIGEQFDDLDRTRRLHLGEEVDAAAFCLVGIDTHIDPAGCTVDRNEQIAPC